MIRKRDSREVVHSEAWLSFLKRIYDKYNLKDINQFGYFVWHFESICRTQNIDYWKEV